MMDVGGVTSRMLSLDLFPTGPSERISRIIYATLLHFSCDPPPDTALDLHPGVQYHHNKKFMERFLANNGSESPYGFHMCWTSNKREKIKYFKVRFAIYIVSDQQDTA